MTTSKANRYLIPRLNLSLGKKRKFFALTSPPISKIWRKIEKLKMALWNSAMHLSFTQLILLVKIQWNSSRCIAAESCRLFGCSGTVTLNFLKKNAAWCFLQECQNSKLLNGLQFSKCFNLLLCSYFKYSGYIVLL